MCKCVMLHGSQPDSDVNLMNAGKCGNRGVNTGLVLLILRGMKEKPMAEE